MAKLVRHLRHIRLGTLLSLLLPSSLTEQWKTDNTSCHDLLKRYSVDPWAIRELSLQSEWSIFTNIRAAVDLAAYSFVCRQLIELKKRAEDMPEQMEEAILQYQLIKRMHGRYVKAGALKVNTIITVEEIEKRISWIKKQYNSI